jgi:putative transcriptional regulator
VEPLRGQLLLAAPSLQDPNFARTVVLVGDHDEQGAMGVVLNRPSTLSVGEAVPVLEQALDADTPVFVGGPVQQSSVVLVAEFLDPAEAALIAFGRIGFPSPQAEIGALTQTTERRRVFAGHAGWGPGQLDAELEQGDWILQPAQPDDVFTDTPQTLWGAVLARKGGRFALLARMPADPSLN